MLFYFWMGGGYPPFLHPFHVTSCLHTVFFEKTQLHPFRTSKKLDHMAVYMRLFLKWVQLSFLFSWNRCNFYRSKWVQKVISRSILLGYSSFEYLEEWYLKINTHSERVRTPGESRGPRSRAAEKNFLHLFWKISIAAKSNLFSSMQPCFRLSPCFNFYHWK